MTSALRLARVPVENGLPVVPEENRAAPAMGETRGSERRMKAAYALFKLVEHARGLAGIDAHFLQIARRRRIHQAGAPNDGIVCADAAPEIGKIDCIEGLAAGQADGLQVFGPPLARSGRRE